MVKSKYCVVTDLFKLFVNLVSIRCCLSTLASEPIGKLSLFVVGGDVAFQDQFPYTVSIQQLRPNPLFKPRFPLWYHFCGGTIIAPYYVLTAAHCFANRHIDPAFLSTYRIVAGSRDISSEYEGQQINFLRRIHLAADDMPSRDPHLLAPRDMALIRLTNEWHWTEHVQPMDLPRPPTKPRPERPDREPRRPPPGSAPPRQPPAEIDPELNRTRTAIMSGFGAIKEINNVGSIRSSLLRYMEVPVIEFDDCIRRIKNLTLEYDNSLDHNDNLCTGTFTGRQEACIGDSGGPLVIMTDDGPVLLGVVSFGMRPCGYFHNAPTVYTKVSRYVFWIKEKMWYDDATWSDYIMVAAKRTFASVRNIVKKFGLAIRQCMKGDDSCSTH